MPDETRRLLLKLAGLSLLQAACAPLRAALQPSRASAACTSADREYDFIVVGSGAGGGPLACNLARACHRVLLLEAGGDGGGRLDEEIPAFHNRAAEDPAVAWRYFVKHYDNPERAAEDPKYRFVPRGVFYPRAATLGGCTSTNAMITVYPHAEDWDLIARVTGDASWQSSNMRRYFERLERCGYRPRGSAGHGFDGWLSTELPDAGLALRDGKLRQAVLAAAEAFAHDRRANPVSRLAGTVEQFLEILNGDSNSNAPDRDGREGLFGVPLATRGGRRCGPRDYILRTIAEGFPLTVQTDALASRVLFDDRRSSGGRLVASGVEYLPGAHLYEADPNSCAGDAPAPVRVRARREVILAAGAFNTPQLLKLSGIGPAAELAAFGLRCLVDLPGVGENLQDRYEVSVVSKLASSYPVLAGCHFQPEVSDPCLTDWKENGGGPYSSSGAIVGMVRRSRPELATPDLFMAALPGNFSGYFPGYSRSILADHRHLSWLVLKAHTANRGGTVRLTSADPRARPEIDFRYFAASGSSSGDGDPRNDVDALATGLSIAREMNAASNGALSLPGSAESVEQRPGPAVRSRAELAAYARRTAWGHHASCSCKIGAADDPLAVLDGDFKVRGTQGLRVVDASVFPRIPGFFIALPIYMVAEKATDAILEDSGTGAGAAEGAGATGGGRSH